MIPKVLRCWFLIALCLVAPSVWAADLDGDGVPDNLDECPQTRPGVRVGKNGCPIPVESPVPMPPVPATTSCPPAPPGAIKDANGCATDEDGDGVPDGLDRCPHTTKGLAVDARGCVVRAAAPVSKKTANASLRRKIVEPLPPLPEEATPALTLSEPVTPRQVIEAPSPAVAAAPASPVPVVAPPVVAEKSPPAAAVVAASSVIVAAPVPTLAPPAPKTTTMVLRFPAGHADLSTAAFKSLDALLAELARQPAARLRAQAPVARTGDGRDPSATAQQRLDIVRVYLLSKGLDPARFERGIKTNATVHEVRRVVLELLP